MTLDIETKQRKASTPKASANSTAALSSDNAPAKMSKLSKKAKESADDAPADAVKPEKRSRKRAADFFASDETEPSVKVDKLKGKQSQKKAKATSDTKPSKEDGHPIETAKTSPGGDMVEVEPAKAPQSKKRKLKGVEDGEAETRAGTAVKVPAEKKYSSRRNNRPTVDGPDTVNAPEQPASAKPIDISKAQKAPKTIKATKAKNAKVAANAEDVKAQTETVTSDQPQKQEKVRKGKAKNKLDLHDVAALNGNGEISKEPKDSVPEKKKANKRSTVLEHHANLAAEDGVEVIPNVMDEEPFQTLLDKESNGAVPQESGLSKPENKQVKKRKAPANTTNLVDRLAQTGSAQKKFRRSEESTADEGVSKGVKDFATSSIEAATKSAAGASDYVGKLIGIGHKSLAEDVTEVAEDVVDEKKAASKAKSAKRGKGKATGDDTKANGSVLRQSESTEETFKLPLNVENGDEEEQDSEADDEVDDQMAALLKGFESSDDDAQSGDEGYKEGSKMPKLPAKTTKELKKVKNGDEPGVVYIGRIPHGFYEQEMRTYFTQFGDVTKLRLSRNKKTGRSKHFAFIEFASKDVASIAAQTMNNYLMFGHILKCHLIPKEQVHENLWKGANRKFRVVPWSKIEARKLEQPATKEVWGKRIEKEKERREKKLEKVKSIGYEFDVGTLKGVEDVGPKAVEDTPMQEAIEAVPQEQEKASKKRKTKKDKALEDVPIKGLCSSDDVESRGPASNEVLERIIIVDSAQSNNGQLVVSEEVTTKKSRKGGKKAKGVETVVADTVAEASESSIPAARIAADEIVENISNVAHSIGQAIGLTSSAEEAIQTDETMSNGAAKSKRKRKAKEDVEPKPAKKGKKEGAVEKKAKPVKEKKEKTVKGKKEQSGKDEVEDSAKEVVKEKKEKGSKKDKESAT